jgi:rifampicin phosphotransferase
MRLLALDQISPRDRDRVGGKALALATLVARGIPVPAGFVVPVEAFQEHLSRGGPDEIRQTALAPSLARALAKAGKRLGPLVAVRSSAVGEDGATASHAGQYETVLGVRPGVELEAALKTCWASAFSARAKAYRGGDEGPPRMAVLVQTLVDAVCAGVLFTINPATGSWREMTVEAAWGLGESVVSGSIVPDHYRVRRPPRSPRPVQRVLARVRLQVVEDAVRPQHSQLRPGAGGPIHVPVPAEKVEAPKLLQAEVLRLCRLGLRIEGLRGAPQDIEWARDADGQLLILQARPVTTARDVRRSGPVVWTRRFVGERWTEPATPLGWSLMKELLDWFIAYPETSRRYLGGDGPTRLLRFAPYLNVTVFRHLAFKIPGAPPPRFMVELLPPEEERGWLGLRAQWPDVRVYRSILAETFADRRWQRFRWNPVRNWKHWDEFEVRLNAALDDMDPVTDRASARARCDDCRELARAYLSVHVCSLLFANIWYQLAEGALASAGRESEASVLLRPPDSTWTLRTNHALWELGRGERTLEDFLEHFGHRANSSWELFSPRWREAPEQALSLARSLADRPDPVLLAAEAQDAARARRDRLPPFPRAIVDLARRYLQLREDQRFHFDRLLWRWKQAWLWLEEDTGLALRFLEAREAEALLEGELGEADASALIERRRAAFDAEIIRRGRGDSPPTFLVGEAAADAPAGGGRLQGQGISAGVVTGIARIVASPDQGARLRPGDILVARATDPGWTPLFGCVDGLVLELGGMLSHGAIVAREYGLPAVVNVPGATTRLVDGQSITVDGGRGVIFVH